MSVARGSPLADKRKPGDLCLHMLTPDTKEWPAAAARTPPR
jgi:hypothetical protein